MVFHKPMFQYADTREQRNVCVSRGKTPNNSASFYSFTEQKLKTEYQMTKLIISLIQTNIDWFFILLFSETTPLTQKSTDDQNAGSSLSFHGIQ